VNKQEFSASSWRSNQGLNSLVVFRLLSILLFYITLLCMSMWLQTQA